MASPQTDKGYTRISNELLEAILKHSFTGNEQKVIFYVIRETYGWDRKKAPISFGMISRYTGISRRNAIRVCLSLEKRGVLFFEGNGVKHAHIMGLQKNYDLWDAPVDNLVKAQNTSDSQTTSTSDSQTTSKRQTSDSQTTRSSDSQTTPSKKERNTVKETERKSAFKNNGLLKTQLSELIKGKESCITNCDPRPVIDALVGAGFDVMRVWGILVESRDKKNPPGYLVSTLCGSQFAVSDSALKKAKGEAEKWNYLPSSEVVCASSASLVSSVANRLCVR